MRLAELEKFLLDAEAKDASRGEDQDDDEYGEDEEEDEDEDEEGEFCTCDYCKGLLKLHDRVT